MCIKYAKGIMWLEDCRIPFTTEDNDNINFDRPRLREKKEWVYELGTTWKNSDVKEYNTQGRFTPNLLVCDDMLNDGSISKTNTSIIKPSTNANSNILGGGKGIPPTKERKQNGDKGTNSRYYDLDLWFEKLINEIK